MIAVVDGEEVTAGPPEGGEGCCGGKFGLGSH